ncbi:MAG TPA: hypothetical protein VEM59_00005 [Acidimicrobiia bacterium]|nr:hypothetical protein [Acidimicrobiia bacterium]
MAETVGYHLRGDPGGEAECGVGMAKVMEADSISVTAKGGVKSYKTTPLMTMDEGQGAMVKAGGSAYEPPK